MDGQADDPGARRAQLEEDKLANLSLGKYRPPIAMKASEAKPDHFD
jgi:hypothetical protein